MNVSLTTGKCLFDPSSSTHCFVPWTPPFLFWSHLEGVPRTAVKSSARLLCPPECRTEFEGWDTSFVHDTVLAPEAGTTALGLVSAPVNTSTHGPGSRYEPATRCALRLSALITPTEMVLTRQCADVSKLTYHMRIKGNLLDPRSTVTCRVILGGRPPRVSLAAGWAYARRLGSRFPLLSPAASCVAPWCARWLTTSASLLAPRVSPSWPSMTRALTQPSHASSQRSR